MRHLCHWPGCKAVSPAIFMCKRHWFSLPKWIRDELKRLNALLHCPNFTGIPTTLRSIHLKLPEPKKPKRK